MSFQIAASGIQIVVLELGNEFYGIEVGHIQEIVRLQPTRSVLDAPDIIEGVTRLRDTVLPVVDLRRCLGASDEAASSHGRLVVTDVGSKAVALVVDGVSEILTVQPEDIELPDSLTASESGLILGVAKMDGRLIVILDPYTLVPAQPLVTETSTEAAA